MRNTIILIFSPYTNVHNLNDWKILVCFVKTRVVTEKDPYFINIEQHVLCGWQVIHQQAVVLIG